MLATVGASLESDEPSVVHGAVDQRGGHVLVAEHAPPAGELDVHDMDHAPGLVGIRYDLEQEPGALLVDRHVCVLMLLYIVKCLGVLFWVGDGVNPLDGPLFEFGQVSSTSFDFADAAGRHA